MNIHQNDLEVLSPAAREEFRFAVNSAENSDDYPLKVFTALHSYPVSVEQFISDPNFLGSDALYPVVLDALIELNNPVEPGREHRARLFTKYTEAVFTGAIGTGKSTLAIYTMAYQLYVLSCYRQPQLAFDLDPTSEIVMVFQNRTERLAKAVDYDRFKALVEQAPYFKKHFRFDHRVKSELRFPNRVIVKPVSGADTAVIGQNVIGGVIDEINFMDTIERSSRSHDGRRYDQATALYESIARRRGSRFQRRGKLPGVLCLVSSRRYPGQFTDTMEQERQRQLKETGQTSIFLYDKRIWDVKPNAYSGEVFQIFIGDLSRKPRILNEDAAVSSIDSPLVIDIPVEHRPEFERDILNSLRDIAGVSTTAIHPYLTNRDSVAGCFSDRRSIFLPDEIELLSQELNFHIDRVKQPDLLRFAHLDLSMTGDATGIVVGCVDRFMDIKRGGDVEVLPHIHIDLVLRVIPPRDGEIPYHRIRELLYLLRDSGVNLKFVSADSFQSVDMLQTLNLKGFMTGQRSMDRTSRPYEFLKSALYDGRVDIPHNETLLRELLALEFDAEKGKVDHPPAGSKDLADSLAGVVYGLTSRREVWVQHNVNPRQQAPKLLQTMSSAPSEEPYRTVRD
jgi:hypothetical protein